jgi:hypothetical protein
VAAADTKLGGYAEIYDQWNFDDPSNGVTNLRGFDDRHASFTVQNAVLDATWTKDTLSGRVALQVGDAPDTYYQSEPRIPAQGTQPASGPDAWRHVQEAWFAWQSPYELELAAGIFLSPIGPEVVATKDNWNWSRSDLFFSLPFYHSGVRVKHAFGDSGWSAVAMVSNGWNNAIDNNQQPSIQLAAAYGKGDWLAQVLYFGGVERSPGAPEGSPWRHLGDAYVQGPVAGPVTFLVHADAGTEHGTFGADSWAAIAGYLKIDLSPRVYLATRGDVMREWHADGGAPIFWPMAWISSATATASWRPVPGLDLRLELRHDHASANAYFGGSVPHDPATGDAIVNRESQTTITGGAIAWF